MNEHKQTDPGKVLLAIDGSPSARSAAYAAAQLASVMHWGLHALYVVDITQVYDMYGNVQRELSELESDMLPTQRRITLFEEQGTLALTEVQGVCEALNVSITTEMIAGNVADIILDNAPKYKLLTLGQRGNRHPGDSEHLGSNFRKIAHHSSIPVLIGEKGGARKKFQRLLLAYDGSELSRLALAWVDRLQRLFSKIMVVSVAENTKDAETWLDERRKEVAASALANPEFIGEQGKPAEIIAAMAASQHADLIAMGAYQHSQFLEWVKDSTLSNVLREVHLPILATR
jgi:nucleotide-binding universal stress UspA family protein